MIKIAYKESSIECSTKEEVREVLRILNELRKENAKEKTAAAGLQIAARVDALTSNNLDLRTTARREFRGSEKRKTRVH